jgi:hypothetical protein
MDELIDTFDKITIKKENIEVYSNEEKLIDICKSFESHSIELHATFMKETILINNCNAVGDILESIFFHQIKKHLSDFEEGPKQKSPDFYACNKLFEYEQKVFMKKPGFDISNFESYIEQLCQKDGIYQKILKTKYLIFEYFIDENKIMIKKFHFLNVWNIVAYSKKEPISMQVKRGVWYNIRPDSSNKWYDKTKTFDLFIKKIIECIDKCNQIEDKENKKKNILLQYEELKNKYTF